MLLILRNKLTYRDEDLYIENYETLIKKLKKTQIKGEMFVLLLEEWLLLKCLYFPKQSTHSV